MSYIGWIRRHVGRQKIFLVFATVILRDARGAVLLQRRTDFDWWGLPGGALELDEDILACARRELLEETGLLVGELSLVGVYTDPRYDVRYPNGDQVQQFTICFQGPVAGGRTNPDGVETTSQRFFPPDQIPFDQMPLWYRDMARDALAGGSPHFCPPAATPAIHDQIAAVRPHIASALYIAPGAMAIVVREDGCLLLIRRRDIGRWALPAGFSDLGENVAHTMVREVREETGWEVEPERILGVYSAPAYHYRYENGDEVKNVGVLFRARLVGGAARPQVEEIQEMDWVEPAEARRRLRSGPHASLFMSGLDHLDDGYFII